METWNARFIVLSSLTLTELAVGLATRETGRYAALGGDSPQ
jgi:hypothetical protein